MGYECLYSCLRVGCSLPLYCSLLCHLVSTLHQQCHSSPPSLLPICSTLFPQTAGPEFPPGLWVWIPAWAQGPNFCLGSWPDFPPDQGYKFISAEFYFRGFTSVEFYFRGVLLPQSFTSAVLLPQLLLPWLYFRRSTSAALLPQLCFCSVYFRTSPGWMLMRNHYISMDLQ